MDSKQILTLNKRQSIVQRIDAMKASFSANKIKDKLSRYHYFGYPSQILIDKLISKIPSNTVDKNSVIAVINDFGLEVISQLQVLGYTNLILLCTESDDKLYNIIKYMVEKEFNFTRIERLQDMRIDDKFDLVIANPPYGYQNCLARKIIKECLDISDTNIFLCPLKSFDFIEHNIISLDKVSADFFDDAKIRELSICEFSRKTFNEEITLESLIMKNNTSFYLIKDFNLTKNKLNIKNCVRSTYANNYQDDCLFLITTWTPLDGVHVDDSAKDIQHNIYKKQLDWTKLDSVDKVIIFNNVVEKDNFTYWWYSNPKSGLADFIISFINKLSINTCDVFTMVLPAIDWSKTDVTYTDEYVLSQMGLKWNENKDGVEKL